MLIARTVVAELEKMVPFSVHCKVVFRRCAADEPFNSAVSWQNCYLLRFFSRILTADCFTKQQFLVTMTSSVSGKTNRCVM